MANEVDPLDYQHIGANSVITLKKRVLEELQAKPSDWIVLLPGKVSGTVILKRQTGVRFDYGDEDPRG
jgi:hypothetical protein